MKRFFQSMLRNIKKNPLYSAINIFGLVLGFTCLLVITVWIQNELSFDDFHKNSKDIYRVHRYFYDPDGTESLHLPYVAPPIAPILEKEIPEIKNIARAFDSDFTFQKDNSAIHEEDVVFAEPEIIEIFTFEGLPDNEHLLEEPMTMIISEKQALKYFDKIDVVNEFIPFTDENGERHEIKITGVFKQWDPTSHFHPEFLISFITFENFVGEEEMQSWGSNNYETFAHIPHMPEDINEELDRVIGEYLENGLSYTRIRLEGLTDIHFNWYSNESYVYILASISLLILIIGSINYMNLNVAMYSRRLGEIKVKKIMGASQQKLTLQLIAESVLFCLVALLIAAWVSSLIVPEFNKILPNPIHFSLEKSAYMIIGIIAVAILTGVLSVIYPSVLLSSFKPTSTTINETLPSGKTSFRTGLVVFQFFVSIALIISFLIVHKQLNFIQHKELGINKDNILVIPPTPQLLEKLEVFKQELLSNPNILDISATKRVPSEELLDSDFAEKVTDGEVVPIDFRLPLIQADHDFLSTYNIRLKAGRNFDEQNTGFTRFLLNETAIRKLGWKNPEEAIGQKLRYSGELGTIIGVVDNFHYESLHLPISPVIIVNNQDQFNRVSIRLSSNNRKETLALIRNTWEKYNIPNYSFGYSYVDDRYQELYQAEENIKTMLSYFMVIAISIAILGLVGLSVFIIQRRFKEIGVRKVNGAKVWEVMALLNKDFVKWVIISFVIACPVAWFGMSQWLEDFAYRTELSWWIFALAGMIALGIALLTVSWQSWRAATRNPVEALRYE